MKCLKTLKAGLFCLACLGMLLPAPLVRAAEAGKARPTGPIRADVLLRHGGLLEGQAVDANAKPLVGMPISLHYRDQQVAATVTDTSGMFRVSGLRDATHEIVCGQMRQTFRTWTTETAPPSAQERLRLVVGDGPVRGQSGPIGYWLGNPWVIAGLVAVAVAVPVAIHNNRAHRPASP
ncbi:MAG: carboxypeptidase regulatory-like domain-containing protein [Pirellulales bacterium]|nr:carboxypeptidase regulatory-like domain-containing protein [Pirellulales bacterium]